MFSQVEIRYSEEGSGLIDPIASYPFLPHTESRGQKRERRH
jgi:hypothetical protein